MTRSRHHAYVIEAGEEAGVAAALAHIECELPSFAKGYGGHGGIRSHPDLVILQYGLLSVEGARRVGELAAQSPAAGDIKAIVIAATRLYHEAQNALLKLFEEPPAGVSLYLVVPSLGALLPTLRSRVQTLNMKGFVNPSSNEGFTKPFIPEIAEEFVKGTREKRAALAKKLSTGKDDDEKRENRDEAVALVSGIEALASEDVAKHAELLKEIAILRGYLHDRSAPVKQILEHLSLVVPRNLV